MDSENQIIGAIDIPWAKDADGNDVETYYQIDGDTVNQIVRHKSAKWKNTASMKSQYFCHWYFASLKSSFNLEPSRKSVSWAKMVAKRCNP